MNWDVLVVGGLNFDFLIQGFRLPEPGESVEGRKFLEAPGGKGANQAVAAARMGARVALIGKVGGDSRADLILERLKMEGINLDYVLRDPLAKTGAAIVMVDAFGRKETMSAPGANHRLTATEIKHAASVFVHSKVVLTELELERETLEHVLELAAGCKARVLLDAAPAGVLRDELFPLIDLLRASSHEASTLTGIEVKDRDSARVAGEKLLALGVSAALIEAGKEGNLLLHNEDELWLPHLKIEEVDATGAGDACIGAMAASFSLGYSLEDAAHIGNAAAALATRRLGAQSAIPTRQEIMILLNRNRYTAA